jgi:L-ascorbate metabolism protein UlaG (beta-lactamase superfamily)
MSDLRITHIGGPTTLIEVDGWRILTDPTFDAPGRTYGFGWGTASRKLTGPAIPVDRLGTVDAVLLTHDHHADNLDDAGRALLPSAGQVVTTVAGARRLGAGGLASARGLAAWRTTHLTAPGRPPIEVTATPCRHGPPLSRPIAGEVTGFVLRWDGQRHGPLWITGDTVLYDGLRRVADRFAIGTTVLHLGAVTFGLTGPLRYTMTAEDGAELCALVGAHTVLPVHYEGWGHFSEGRPAAETAFHGAPPAVRDSVRWLTPGEATSVTV